MCWGNNSIIWLIIIILLFGCGNSFGCGGGCCNDNNCGGNCGGSCC